MTHLMPSAPKPAAVPTVPTPVAMPTVDQDSLDEATKKQAQAAAQTSGRQSTILSDDSDKLGG